MLLSRVISYVWCSEVSLYIHVSLWDLCHCPILGHIVGIKLYCSFSLTLWLCILMLAEVTIFHFEGQLTSFKLTLLPNYKFGTQLFRFISLLKSRLTRLTIDTQIVIMQSKVANLAYDSYCLSSLLSFLTRLKQNM